MHKFLSFFTPKRTILLAAALLGLLVLVSLIAGLLKRAGEPPQALPNLKISSFATGLDQPTDLASTNVVGDGRLFVVERPGRIKTVEADGRLSATFLDITSRVNSLGAEEGLLGLAFHPDYFANGRFFVYYVNQAGNLVISEFSRQSSHAADAASERQLLVIAHPLNTNHNGGELNFGPDGLLYIGTGDGGAANDPPNNAQNLESLLGKLLRIDVNGEAPYAAPSDNPWAGPTPGRDEIWAYGLRNPWRFSFDLGTGDLYIGDVGQAAREEINYQAAGSRGGQNYGWRCREGLIANPNNPAGCTGFSGYVDPIVDYETQVEETCSVIGGYVYRGSQYPRLSGYYLYADFCSGHLWGLKPDGAGGWQKLAPTHFGGRDFSSFGQAADGELYLADLNNGTVYHLQEGR